MGKIVPIRKKKRAPAKSRPPRRPAMSALFASGPMLRCSRDPRACPISASIVAVRSEYTESNCVVCGRPLRLRGKPDPQSGQMLARVPSHHRADNAEEPKTERLRAAFSQHEKAARAALARRSAKRASQALRRAWSVAERLPGGPENFAIGGEIVSRRLTRLDQKLREVKTALASAMPRNPRRLFNALVTASGFDVTAVEPDTFIEHLAGVLPQSAVARIAKQSSRKWIRLGIEAVLRWARPRKWDDLERPGFAGDRSVMSFLREFPGLEYLRIPDQAYETTMYPEVPF